MSNPFALDAPATAPAPPATATAPGSVPASPPPASPALPAEADPFDNPAPQAAKGPRIRDMYGRLLLIIPHKLEEQVKSRFTDKDGNIQYEDKMTADVIVLDGGPIHYGGKPEKVPPIPHNKTADVPLKNARMLISLAGLVSQCREALAKKLTTGQPGMVLGRLSVGEARGDNNAPYLLALPTDADRDVARAYLKTVDPFAP